MKYPTLLLLVLLAVGVMPARSQTFSLEVNPGVGTFAMQGLKRLVQSQNTNDLVPTGIVQNYPAFLVFDAKGLFHGEQFRAGITGKYMSSGARISYRDYSGELRVDHLSRAYAVGGSFEKPVWTLNQLSLLLVGDLVLVRSFVDIKSYVAVHEESDSQTLGITSIGLGAEPAVRLRYRLGRFSTGINAGYFANWNAGLHLRGNRRAVLNGGANGGPIRADWSGVRGSLHLAVDLN